MEVVGSSYGLSSNGWVDSELFKGWLVDHFLLDSHSSHYQPDLIKYVQDYQVILFCLPPRTTHESQPLDVSIFKSLKQSWLDCCHRFNQSNSGLTITKYHFLDS